MRCEHDSWSVTRGALLAAAQNMEMNATRVRRAIEALGGEGRESRGGMRQERAAASLTGLAALFDQAAAHYRLAAVCGDVAENHELHETIAYSETLLKTLEGACEEAKRIKEGLA